ncbi:MAG: TlpA family protein disulfide reductase [Gammaproteobacteria bacterium]|nr:TlpA family protein disulfide reductase [Gammaproteobacteria bacterium]
MNEEKTLFHKMNVLLLLLLASLTMSAYAAAPDVNARDVDGKTHNVNQYIGQGKWTVVVFWAHDCHICNLEIEQMTFFHDDHSKKDATVLGISMDGFKQVKKSKAFIERHELNFPNLLIEQSQAEFRKFGGGGFVGTPTFYLYNPAGELLAKNIGPVSPEDLEKFIKAN